MSMQLTDFIYNEPSKYYNSERREQVGMVYHTYGDGENPEGYNFQGMQLYTIDTTDTSQANPKYLTVFTFANGVTEKMKYYYDSNSNSVQCYLEFFDTNGNKILNMPSEGTNNFNLYASSENPYGSNYKFYFNPTGLWYAHNPPNNTNPESLMYGFAMYYKDTASPYERPEPRGELSYQIVNRYYGSTITYTRLSNQADIDRFFQLIENNGDGTPITPILPSEDTSEPGGGDHADPHYDPFSDPVDFPGLPTGGSGLATGFIRAYEPTATQLNNLASELWDENFWQQIRKIQNDPMEAIISLHSIPFSVGSGSAVCKIGNYVSSVSMPTVTAQYHKRNLGSLYIPEHWASALDYSPYVTVDLFVPFLGIRSVQVDDIVGRTISLEYNVDVITGASVIHLKSGSSVLYTWNTNLMAGHPISSSSMALLYQGIAGAVGSALSGMTAGVGGAVGGAIGGAINVALSKHSSVSRGGSIAGNSGILGNFTPYIIIHRPIQSLASGFAHFKGYPSNITTSLSSVTGYTEVESVHLSGITCTDSEKAEIEALLYNGVLL